MKCIHFTLPSGAGGMAAAMVLGKTRSKLNDFCRTHNIKDYRAHVEGYNWYVCFNEEKFYTLFVLGWDPVSPDWRSYTIVEKEDTENFRLVTL